jgi:hypothetical protein
MVAEILKLPQFSEDNGMSEVEIGTAWITAELNGKRRIGCDGSLDFLYTIIFRDNFRNSPGNDIHLFVERWK